jgi:excisionase family DNA binding protein
MSQSIPKEISTAAARMLEPYAPGLTAERLAEAITYQPEAESERLLTRREVASRLRVSMPTCDRLLRSGQLPKRRIRGAVRVPASAVEAILNGKAVA